MNKVIYDRYGAAKLILIDEKRFINYYGNNLGFLRGIAVYNYNGRQVGWYEGGILRDLQGHTIGFTDLPSDSPRPLLPIHRIPPIPPIPNIPPIPPIPNIPHIRPIKSFGWSPLALDDTFFGDRYG